MSVSYQQIIEKMKIELQSVDASSNEAEIRAKMYAIRSLADVVLVDEAKEEEQREVSVKSEPKPKQSTNEASGISPIEAKMMGIEQPSKPSKSTWHENDANGESIFDF